MPRPKGNRKNSRLTVSLDDKDYEILQSLAHKEDVSVAWLVRKAIQDMLVRHAVGIQSELPLTQELNQN